MPETPTQRDPRPTLPAASRTADAQALQALRRFHVDPQAEPGGVPEGVLPALLEAQRDVERVRTDEPFFLGPSEGGEALTLPLPDLLSRLASQGGERLLTDNLLRLERQVRRTVVGQEAPVDAREVLARAGEGLADELDLGADDRSRFEKALESFLEAVPAGGVFLPFGPELPLRLLAAAVHDRLPASRAAFVAEARSLVTALDRRLEADRQRRRPEGAGETGEDLGDLGSRFVDSSALAGVAGKRRGGTGLPETHRRRLEEARETLAGFALEAPDPVLVRGQDEGVPENLEGIRMETADDPCAQAAELFDQAAEDLARTLAAARRARLVEEDKYEPERQDPWLDRLSWRDLDREELHLLTPVVAQVSADWLARGGLASLSRLLLSGRTVQVLVTVDPAVQPGMPDGAPPETEPRALAGFRFEAGYLGLAYREAFVQQGSAVRPARLLDGFRRALRGGRPALHVVAVPAAEAGEPGGEDGTRSRVRAWLAAGAALEGRAHPLFLYDPQAGPTWARRMDFTGNPTPEQDWPGAELVGRTDAGAEQTLDLAFTFGDYALLAAGRLPGLAGHFRPAPAGVPEAELTPLAQVLAASDSAETPTLPFVWGVDPEGRLLRLVVSRPLLAACRDRLDLWRALQELAGIKSEYVDEAVEQVRAELTSRFAEERERLEAEHAEELERVRRTAAEEVATRMTAALLELDVASLLPPSGTEGDGFATYAAPSFAGRSPDEVAARLLEMVDPETLDPDAAPAGGSQVDRMTAELMKLVAGEEPS